MSLAADREVLGSEPRGRGTSTEENVLPLLTSKYG